MKPYLTDEAKKKLEIILGGVSLISTIGKFECGYKNMVKDSDILKLWKGPSIFA